jgi:nonribosomal peptide synthetase DhbF
MTKNDVAASSAPGGGGSADRLFELFADAALGGSVIERFRIIARRFASRVAIADTAISLTYAELAMFVDRIAATVTAATEGRKGPVALLLPGDARLPAAMLGVLAAGRAYVPLDADFPAERNALIVSEANPCTILSIGKLGARVRALGPRDMPVIDIENLPTSQPSDLATPARPDNVAAIYYTSGSSGMPKGVAWSQRTLLRWVGLFTNTVRISCTDRTVLLFSASTSASYRCIYSALLNGAALHMLSPPEMGLAAITRQIRARGVTIIHVTPKLMRDIAENLGGEDRLDSVRVVCIGGERVQWSDVDACQRSLARDVLVYTVLSSTETGPFIHAFVDDGLRATMPRPPAGRVAIGWTVTIVDDAGQTVADGEVGNITVTSPFVALGYWRGPELDVRPFPFNPADPAERVFASGDRGYRRADGLIECVGRSDHQIKLRGHRIEIDEVEFALGQCAGVADAAVVVRSDEFGLARSLAAYVEPTAGAENLKLRALRSLLVKRLPRYMIPATITLIARLPRLPNLKIDRVGLARIDTDRVAQMTYPIDDPLIAELIAIFESVLGDVRATPEDNVSSLGGDSLQAVKVAIELQTHFGIPIPQDIFETTQTIRELARWLAEQKASSPRDT